MKKMIFVVFAIMVIALFGCSSKDSNTSSQPDSSSGTEVDSSDSSEISGKITFASYRTDLVELFKEASQQFNEKYPEAEVEIETLNNYEQVMKVRLTSNSAPDVILYNREIIPSSSQYTDFLAPLDDLGYQGKIYFEEANSHDGHLYGVNEGLFLSGMVYNKNTFEKAGITSEPETLDELLDIMETLKNNGVTPIALNFKTQWPFTYWNTYAQAIAGEAQYREKWLDTDAPFAKDTPDGELIELLREIKSKGYAEEDLVNGDWEPSRIDVVSGKTAMFYLGNFAIPVLQEFGLEEEAIGFFPLPVDNKGTKVSSMRAERSYGINKNTENQATAKAFVQFMLEDFAYADRAGLVNAVKDIESSSPQVVDFMAHEPIIYETALDSNELTKVMNQGQVNVSALIQEALLAEDEAEVEKVFEKYNKMWQQGKQ